MLICVMLFSFTLTCFAEYTNSKTPQSAENANLKWSLKLGQSRYDYPSAVTVVDDTIVVMCKKTLYKINAENGKILKTAEMVATPGYGVVSVTFGDGVLYCPLGSGQIQAFDYNTMESLWVYKDEIGGQSLCPITYEDGYIYTGFWKGEDKFANYVCIDVVDENKKESHEEKKAEWVYKSLGGFYWAGASVVGEYVVFGTDDGTSDFTNTAQVLSLSKRTGKKADSISVKGDVRSSVASYNSKLYFATKAGYLYSVKLKDNGTFDKSSLKTLNLGGSATATPVVFNSRLYIGVQAEDGFDSGYIKVINADTLKLIYSAKTKGYVQSPVLISDAYFEETGNVYVYATYNSFPGGITVLTDSPQQTTANVSELFTPTDDKAQYSICSLVADEDGTIYYKNDSGYIFAVENTENVSWFIKLIRKIIAFFANLFN